MSSGHDFIRMWRDIGRKFLSEAIPILRDQRQEAKVDLYEPIVDEVLGGLFARTFRFLHVFVLDYHLWLDDLGRAMLRMTLESVFYMRFLVQRNEPEVFLAFQRYGLGHEKLYKMQLRKLVEEGKLENSPDLQSYIDSDSDEEVCDELIDVRLKNFEDVRKVATDAGMKDEYVLTYHRESLVIHGHWPTLRKYYLQECTDPLHRGHLQPYFGLPPLNPALFPKMFHLFQLAYKMWIDKYGLEDRLSPLVDKYFEEIDAAAPTE